MKKMISKKILKESVVLLITVVMILSVTSVMANTDETKLVQLHTKAGIKYVLQPVIKEHMPSRLDDFTECFEGGSVPIGWLNVDYDGDAYIWEIKFIDDGWLPYSGDYSIASASYINEPGIPLTPDNWLITLPMTASATSELTYYVSAQDQDWSQEHLEVWISTTGVTVPDDFTDQVDDYTCPAGSNDYVKRTVNLSSYDGEIIYIAFRHCDITDMFWIKIDDITVTDVEVEEPGNPDLDCSGTLSWIDVTTGCTVDGSFTVENVGDTLSFLNWEIESYPDWGTWTITPESGTGLSYDNSVIVEVTVVAPDESDTEFTGEVKIVNSDDPNDFCIIDVSLATSANQYSEGIFGITIIRGFVFNVKQHGTDITFRAIRLHYITISSMEKTTGVMRFQRCSMNDFIFERRYDIGPLGSFTWMFGICRGGLTEI